jgi:hypothetical protein
MTFPLRTALKITHSPQTFHSVMDGTISLGGADSAEVFLSTTLRAATARILVLRFKNSFCLHYQSKFEHYRDE